MVLSLVKTTFTSLEIWARLLKTILSLQHLYTEECHFHSTWVHFKDESVWNVPGWFNSAPPQPIVVLCALVIINYYYYEYGDDDDDHNDNDDYYYQYPFIHLPTHMLQDISYVYVCVGAVRGGAGGSHVTWHKGGGGWGVAAQTRFSRSLFLSRLSPPPKKWEIENQK